MSLAILETLTARRLGNNVVNDSDSTDRTIVLVDKFCNTQEMTSYSFTDDGPQVTLVTILLSVVYVTMGFVIIYFIKIQERNARLGDSKATQSVIFPVFVSCLWLNSFVNMSVGIIFILDIYMKSAFLPAFLFASIFMLQHMLVDGITFLLMKKGLGWDGVRSSLPVICSWGLFTGLCKFMAFYAKFSAAGLEPDTNLKWLSPLAAAMNYIWGALLFTFYGVVWFAPQKNLFRRPAAINYATFWFSFRLFAEICAILMGFLNSSKDRNPGYCVLEISPFFIIAALEPLIVYYTLLQDSRWWQGLDINQGKRRRDAEGIRSPLEGVDIGLGAAQALANTMDFMQEEEVRLLNFAYITLDTNGKNMLGSGSFSKVYKGAYKGEVCAVKLIFTVDLTADVIRRVAAEAQILSRIVHINIVKTFGVSVLPPSVCILLEYCEMGSLQDVVKGSGIFSSTGRISSLALFSPYVCLTQPLGFRPRTGVATSGSPWLDGSGCSMRSDGKSQITHLTSSTGSLHQHEEVDEEPHTKISTADRLWLALGCASGIGALHEYNSNLCHRDIKSFNFLVDSQLRVKLADMELGVSDDLSEKGTINKSPSRPESEKNKSGSVSPGKEAAHIPAVKQAMPSESHASSTESKTSVESTFQLSSSPGDIKALSLDTTDTIQAKATLVDLPVTSVPASGMSNVAADPSGVALQADDFLANWAAPEVVRRLGHTQSSDMYATTLVLWELLSGQVPFSLSGPEYHPVRQDEVRRRILLGERPEVPMVQGDEKFLLPEPEEAAEGYSPDDTKSPLYDGYGSSDTLATEKKANQLLKIPGPEHIISTDSPYAKYIHILRKGWADAPEERYTARELFEELHGLWRALCHDLVMFVHYDPNTNSSYFPADKKNSMLESRLAQATDCVGLRSYHTEYENANKALGRNESNIGSTFSALVRSNSQADSAYPPMARSTSYGGVFSSLIRSNSQVDTKSPKSNRSSFNSTLEGLDLDESKNVHVKSSSKGAKDVIDEAATSENFQCILACVQADPSYAALDADGGAWVVVSSSCPHFLLRTTSAFCDLLGQSSSCVGSPIEDMLDVNDEDVRLLKQFLYEMTLFSMHSDSVMRRQEHARCTTTIYPSYYCNHLLINLPCTNPAEKMTAYGISSVDSEESGGGRGSYSGNRSSEADKAAGGSSHSTKSGKSKPVSTSAVFSVHAFPLFGANPSQKANPSTEVDADMTPVAYALLFSEFKRKVGASRTVPEAYPRTLGGMFGKMKDVMFGRKP